MSEKTQQNKPIAENLDPRALRAALQERQASRPGLAALLDRAADQIRPKTKDAATNEARK